MDNADVSNGQRDEFKFRKWFEKNGTTFRESLAHESKK